MPRNVRPSWIEIDADGRTPIATGPRASNGRMEATFKVRKDGGIFDLLEVIAQPDTFGNVTTVTIRIYTPDGTPANEIVYRCTVTQ